MLLARATEAPRRDTHTEHSLPTQHQLESLAEMESKGAQLGNEKRLPLPGPAGQVKAGQILVPISMPHEVPTFTALTSRSLGRAAAPQKKPGLLPPFASICSLP